jgi:FkbM family methyltransferase
MNLGNYNVPSDTINGVCVDVGANLGDFTNKYLNHFKKIFYIEPQISLFNNLQKRFEGQPHVVGFNNAVWSEPNINLELVWHDNLDFGSVGIKGEFVNDHWTNNVVNSVMSISLEELFNKTDLDVIDYLKLDCETSEYPFIYGKDLSKIRYIGMELHFQMGEQRYNELLSWVKKTHVLIHGNDSYGFNDNKEVLFKLK